MVNKLRKNINNFEIKFKFLFHILTDFYYVNEKTLNNIASFDHFILGIQLSFEIEIENEFR